MLVLKITLPQRANSSLLAHAPGRQTPTISTNHCFDPLMSEKEDTSVNNMSRTPVMSRSSKQPLQPLLHGTPLGNYRSNAPAVTPGPPSRWQHRGRLPGRGRPARLQHRHAESTSEPSLLRNRRGLQCQDLAHRTLVRSAATRVCLIAQHRLHGSCRCRQSPDA
jgi:hypothetical protein